MYTNSLHLSHLSMFLLLPAVLLSHSTCRSDSVTLEKRIIKNATLYAITADLNDPSIEISIRLASKGISNSESFQSMMKRSAPIAAITGTYFDTRTLFPVGSIITKGETVYENAIGTAVCFIRPSNAECVDFASSKITDNNRQTYTVKFLGTKKGDRCDWTGVECGLRAGPMLLSNGHYAFNPSREGFKHPGLFGARTRIALGHTPHNKLLLVAVRTPVTFATLAGIMKALGASEAIALDGGTSSAMYYQGKIICKPGRALTNIIEIRKIPITDMHNTHIVKDPIKPTQNVGKNKYVISAVRGLAGGEKVASRQRKHFPLSSAANIKYYAILNAQIKLSITKSRHTVFPVNRAEFACLKSLNYSKNFVNISANT